MKLTTLEKVRWAMEDMAPQVEVQPDVRERARQALMRMLEIV
jgi:quinolinate synthase